MREAAARAQASPPHTVEILNHSQIVDILDYIRPDHVILLQAALTPSHVRAKVKFRSVEYTRKPVQYLAIAESTVALAQATQLLFDSIIRSTTNPYSSIVSPQELANARRRHDLVFSRMDIRCAAPICDRDGEYYLDVTLTRLLYLHRTIHGKFTFDLSLGKHAGSFLAALPLGFLRANMPAI